MKKADKQAKEIVDKFNMKPSILIEVESVNEQEMKNYIEKQQKDFIDFIRSCEFLKASFKKGDVVLIDGWQERIVVQEFENGCVELESKNGCTLIGKGRLTLAPKSL